MESIPMDPAAADRPPAFRPALLPSVGEADARPTGAPASPAAVAMVAAVRSVRAAMADGRATELLDRVSRLARAAGAGVMVLDRDDAAGELVMALRARPREAVPALVQRAQQFAAQFGAGAPDDLRIAIGGVTELDRIAESVGQARLALAVAARVGVVTSPLHYDDLGLYAFLQRALAASPEEGRRFVEHVLSPLSAYDAATGSTLVRTLRVYFANDGSVDRTATALALHRHTVHYRLGRITDLTRRNPSTTRGRDELSLALIIAQLLPE